MLWGSRVKSTQQYLLFLVLTTLIGLIGVTSGTTATESEKPTKKWKTEMLVVHNNLRRTVVPPTANSHFLEWDGNLEELAQQAAERCDYLHSSTEAFPKGHPNHETYANLGENIFKGGYTDPERAIMLWFSERYYYDYNTTLCQENKQCGHYHQMTTYTVKKLGCGHAVCTEAKHIYIYCLYDRGARQKPYTAGKPCSSCEAPDTFCVDDLCVPALSSAIPKNCKLGCHNCAPLYNEMGRCQCGPCPFGTKGILCNELESDAKPPTKCDEANTLIMACQRNGRPCLNGGKEISNDICECQCSKEYSGDRCQFQNTILEDCVEFNISGPVYDNNIYPISPYKFRTELWTNLTKQIVSGANQYCSDKNCCPDEPVGTYPLATSNQVVLVDTFPYPKNMLNGELTVMLYTRVDAKLCKGTKNGGMASTQLADIVKKVVGQSSTIKSNKYTTSNVIPSITPTSATTKPTVATTKPTVATTKPTSATTKPTVATTKPTSATTKPTVATTKPTSTTTKPTSATTNPTSATTKPTSATTKPTVATTKPTVATTKPSSTTTKPTSATTKPTVATTKPSPATTKSRLQSSTTLNGGITEANSTNTMKPSTTSSSVSITTSSSGRHAFNSITRCNLVAGIFVVASWTYYFL